LEGETSHKQDSVTSPPGIGGTTTVTYWELVLRIRHASTCTVHPHKHCCPVGT